MGWMRFWRRERIDRERGEEIEEYLAIETADNVARGMDPATAQAAARRKLGNGMLAREEIYEMNTLTFLDATAKDIRYALRGLWRSPVFTAAAAATLAIGIGANTAVFSVVNSVLLEPLHYPKSGEIVALHQLAPGAEGLGNISDGLRLSQSLYLTYAEHNRTFQSMGIYVTDRGNVTGLAEPEEVRVIDVTGAVLETFGVAPAVGRWLAAEDFVQNGPSRVMLGYGYWQKRFSGEKSAVGKTLWLNGKPREIVGVMPRGFRIGESDFELLLPVAIDRPHLILAGFGWTGVGRLKPGVTIEQANADLKSLLPLWTTLYTNGPGYDPHIYDAWRITPALRPLKEEVVGGARQALWAVMGTIGLVMLIACANLTNLLLARAEARQQDLALRAALGAGRGRIVRSLLAESLMLGLAGGMAGVGLAAAGVRLLAAIGPAGLPRLEEIGVDERALLFALVLSVLAGFWLGAIPALRYVGAGIASTLRSAGRTASVSRERHRARNLLAIAQVAMAVVLVVSAALMIRTALKLRAVTPGFTRPEQIQIARIGIPQSMFADPESAARAQQAIVDRMAAIPGVQSAAFATSMPMETVDPDWDAVFAEGKERSLTVIPPLRLFEFVSPGYLRTMGTRLVSGRDFTWTDLYGLRPVVMVSENLARELWGSAAAATGKRVHTGMKGAWQEVIGVVEDVRANRAQDPAPPTVYWPTYGVDPYGHKAARVRTDVTFAVRSSRAGTEALRSEMMQAVWSVSRSLPLAGVRTMADVYEESMARTSFTLTMLEIAGTMALLLGIVGIYGVISYAASQRTREMGIRIALGAEPAKLRSMFLRSGLALAGAGVAIGLPAAALAMQGMKSLLFGVGAVDPVSYVTAPVVLALAAVAASWGPARRAARVDPVVALRGE